MATTQRRTAIRARSTGSLGFIRMVRSLVGILRRERTERNAGWQRDYSETEMTDTKTVQAVCGYCGGSGVFKVPNGGNIATVCMKCSGTGAVTKVYVPFVRRLHRDDVEEVKWPKHESGYSPVGESITYAEFEQGKMPPIPKSSE